jgi:hypothetical protein
MLEEFKKEVSRKAANTAKVLKAAHFDNFGGPVRPVGTRIQHFASFASLR